MENQKTFKEKNVPTNTSHKKRGGKEKEIPNIQSIEFSTVNKKPVTNKSKPDKLNQSSDRINNELSITNRLKGHPARALVFEEQRSPCTERPARVFPTFSLNTAAGTHVPSTSSGNKCLLSGLPQPDLSNLVRFHKSPLGKSAPSLSANMMELGISRRSSRSTAAHRLSLIAGINTSPVLHRSHSPVSSGSPVDSPPPRTFSPSLHLVSAAVPVKRGTVGCRGDGRRWSVASLPSSGYGTTPGSSNISSKCSSQERLHQLPNVPTGDEIKLFTGTAVAAAVSSDENLVLHQPPFRRPRSRSLSSSSRSPVVDEMPTMDMLYKERFPKATQEMEEKLRSFLNENKELEHSSSHEADLPIARFVHHQVLEIARDCLTKSEAKLITSEYFCEISEKLERLKIETKEKSPQAATHITNLITKLLLIISRPALLLECFEFSLEEFYHLMEAAEGEAKMMQVIKTDIPQYIIQKLGLNRDPIAELQQELKSSEPEEEERKPTTISTTPTEEDFEVLKLISNGAYGAVYLVKHKQTRQRFAMKKINKNNLILRNQVEQVFAERDILSFADNPFVVSMYCSFETRRHLCLVMEYVEGGDCASLLKNIGPLPSDMARFYFAETVLAVEYLHSYGIVHRDLKPDNLLITVLGHIKLTDFGLSKMGLMSLATNLYEGHINSETQEFSDKQLIGTPEYIAPEVILRQGYGKPIDWWSMGIILYEFIVGCVPFYGDSVEELFDRIVRDDVDWPEDEDWPIQLEAKDLVICLLSKSPRDRLGTASPHEVKEHVYFIGLDWNSLLRQKAEFVPELKNDEDTSYFDSRLDRYNHEIADDTDDTDESSVFPSFSSCPRQYRQVGPRLGSDSSVGSLNTPSRGHFSSPVMPTTPDTPDAMTDFHKLRITYALTPDSENPLYWKMLLELNNKALSTPESSQTDSDDVSPQTHRKRRTGHTRDPLPRLAVSMEDELSSGYEVGTSSSESVREQLVTPVAKHRSRSVVKSASATGLSLIIPSEFQTDAMNLHSPSRGGGSSTASSRDASPCREPSPLVTSYKPPIMIKRGPSGFGFSVHTVRVYYGDTDFYTTHHLVMAVDEGGPAYESGLRPTDLITHVNGETVQGLYHSQVLQLLLGGGEQVILRATPLEHTSIQTGGRKRSAGQSKLARRPFRRQRKQKRGVTDTATDKRRKASLFRKISSKRASVEMQQMISTPTMGPTNRNQSFACASDGPFINHSPIRIPSEGSPAGRSSLVLSDNSSRSSTASSSAGETPPGVPPQPHYQRPSTLHGLKHKLHSSPCSKPLHKAGTGGPGRRKSIGHMPLSPLARTPSPGPLPASPTRSPSPLTFPVGHQQGSSNTTQSYSPGVPATRSPAQGKKSYVRPKSAEPGSPLLRRALSPDRLHPRSAEGKISPLCSSTGTSGVKTTPRVSAGLASTGASVWRPASGSPAPVLTERNTAEPTETAGTDKDQTGQNAASSTVLSLPLAGPGEFLPRIAEEKDSPTNVGAETQSFSGSNENKDTKKNDGLG